MLKTHLTLTVFWLFILASLPLYSTAQESLLDNVIQSKRAVVMVKAIQAEVRTAPKAAVVRNPKTGRVAVVRQAKAAAFQRNGSGVLINPHGLIVTNLHTVKHAHKILIKFYENTTVGAQILHIMPKHDLALLKASLPFPLHPIEFADSNSVRLGDEVINVGSSDFLKNTLSGGRVIGLGTSETGADKKKNIELIQVNINIYKGDSGGPLLNREGKLIGMMAAKLRKKEKAAFAIPSNKIKKLYLDYSN